MGDFDIGFTGNQREPDYSRQARPGEGRYEHQYRRQGFTPPYDRSPVSVPSGWYDGSVHQTGGMVMVRIWGTLPNEGIRRAHDSRPGNKYEYAVEYGDNPGVSLNRYKWSPQYESYVFDGEVDSIAVERNTDQAKAEAAQRLMRQHNRS